MSWDKIALTSPPIPTGPLQEIITLLREVLNLMLQAVQAALAVARLINDPIASALEAIVNEIEATIASFLDDMGGYMLFVPIQRRIMHPFHGGGDLLDQMVGNIPVSKVNTLGTGAGEVGNYLKFNDLQVFADPAFKGEPNTLQVAASIAANKYAGGNAGFLRCVSESLYDGGDPNRPKFNSEQDYVAGVVILAGTDSDIMGLLEVLRNLGLLFGRTDGFPNYPKPTNLTAKARNNITYNTVTQATSDGQIWVTLNWDPPKFPITSFTDLGGVRFRPVNYAIIRGKNKTLMLAAKHLSQIGILEPLEDLEGEEINGITIEKVGKYDPTMIGYEDLITGVHKDDIYYYAVAWQLQAFGPDEEVTAYTKGQPLLPWGELSNIARVTLNADPSAGTRPNWSRTSSVRDVCPAVAQILEALMAAISRVASRITGASKAADELIKFIESEIAKYTGMVDEILGLAEMLLYLLQPTTVGLYVHTFYGQGGNMFFLQDLTDNLYDTSNPGDPAQVTGTVSCPPFLAGDEYVTGIVLMAGGRNPNVKVFSETLSWLFGLKKGGATRDKISAIFDSIDTAGVETAYDALVAWRPESMQGSLSAPTFDEAALLANLEASDIPEEIPTPETGLDASLEPTEEPEPELVFTPDMCPLCTDSSGESCVIDTAEAWRKALYGYATSQQFNPDLSVPEE